MKFSNLYYTIQSYNAKLQCFQNCAYIWTFLKKRNDCTTHKGKQSKLLFVIFNIYNVSSLAVWVLIIHTLCGGIRATHFAADPECEPQLKHNTCTCELGAATIYQIRHWDKWDDCFEQTQWVTYNKTVPKVSSGKPQGLFCYLQCHKLHH